MANFIKKQLHPLGGKIIFWNIFLLVFVKIIVPQSTFQLASLIDQISPLSSREIIALTNEVRSDNGLNSLNPSFQLDAAANEKLNDMVKNGYFAHISPQGTTPWFWIKKSDYIYSAAGENLAMGFLTSKDTVQAWYNSSSHRANLLNKNYKDIGVAVGKGKIDDIEGVIIVQMFGSSRPNAGAADKPKQVVKTVEPEKVIAGIPMTKPVPLPSELILPSQDSLTPPAPQHVSTDQSIKTIIKPTIIAPGNEKRITDILRAVNTAFTFYSFIFATLSLFAFFLFNNRDKHMVLKTLSHINILILSLAISSAEVTIKTIIF